MSHSVWLINHESLFISWLYPFENLESPIIEDKGSHTEDAEVKIEEDDGEDFPEEEIEQIEEIKEEKPDENNEFIQLVLEEGEEDMKTEEVTEARTRPLPPLISLNSGSTPTVLPESSGFQIQVPGQFETNQGSGMHGPCGLVFFRDV